ncbi:MAG: TlpA family protein disulfide reductase, partial [Flavobacteriales bacterium]
MKKLALLTTFGLATLAAFAQFGTAPDFNVTDLDGNTHQLYADILDQGLIAVVDVSATWCPPCWSLHN